MDDKRLKILNAVIDLIKTDGINSGIKMSSIAKKADIGKGTIYEYFKNKDQVITETLLYMMHLGNQSILFDPQKTDMNFEEALTSLITRIIESITRNGSLYNLLAHQKLGNILNHEMKLKIHNKMIEMRTDFEALFEGILEKGIEEQKISSLNNDFEIKCALTTLLSCTMDFVREECQNINEKKNEFTKQLVQLIIKMVS